MQEILYHWLIMKKSLNYLFLKKIDIWIFVIINYFLFS